MHLLSFSWQQGYMTEIQLFALNSRIETSGPHINVILNCKIGDPEIHIFILNLEIGAPEPYNF